MRAKIVLLVTLLLDNLAFHRAVGQECGRLTYIEIVTNWFGYKLISSQNFGQNCGLHGQIEFVT